jgi:hypothetical protein
VPTEEDLWSSGDLVGREVSSVLRSMLKMSAEEDSRTAGDLEHSED